MLKRVLFIFFLTNFFCSSLLSKPFPISFAIPECKIISSIPQKDRDFAFLIPGKTETYIYDDEKTFYAAYSRSYFAITCKKGGWDCLRHYEILASGCIPYFIDLDKCDENTMIFLPKKLIQKAMNLPGVSLGHIDHQKFNKKEYFKILAELLDYTHKYLTTRYLAQYFLKQINYKNGTILFLSNGPNPDYLKTILLIGLKEILGNQVIDFPKQNYIYTNYEGDTKKLYGKGFSYTKIVDDIPTNRENIVERIKNHDYEFVVYAHPHYGLLFHDLVKKYYDAHKIAYLCGEDAHANCPFASLTNAFLREYNAYTNLR